MLCPGCGQENAVGARFCNECGARVDFAASEPLAPSPEPQFRVSAASSPPEPGQSSGPGNPGLGAFVGHQREMAELRATLEDARSGQGRLVMLVGEPGIGKTRTAQELASHAEALGVQVLWGRCFEEEGAPPYWPWVQPIRSYVQTQSQSQLEMEMGPGAADIAEIVRELREKLPNLETPPALEPEQARFRLFTSITSFLKNAAMSQPLVLVLDDLHWADRSSLLLLEFLAREIQSSRLLVLGTYRDVEVSRRHPLSETLGSLIREQRFLRVQLPGLTEPEIAQLIQKAAAGNPPPGLSATIHQRTEGNPLFVTEIIAMLTREGLGEGQDYLTSIPEGVRDAIGRRLNRLSEGCNRVLTTASVVGREFDFRLLGALMDEFTEAQLLGLVEEALEAHVIEEVSAGEEGYQFSHALIQETLSAESSTSRKVRLHARIAEALEEIYGPNAVSRAGELAYHYFEAETILGSEMLVYYARLAGEQALAAHAYAEALVLFQRGLTAKGVALTGTAPAGDADAAELLFGLARAQSATVESQQFGEAFATLSRAFEYYAAAGDIAQAVAAAEFPIGAPIGRIPGGGQLIVRALTLVPDDSHEAGRLFSRYGGFLGLTEGDYEGAQQALGRAIAIARREGDVPLEVQTLTYAADVSGQHLHWQESIDHGLRSIELATAGENPYSEVYSRFWTAVSLLHTGDPDAARPHALVLRDLAERRSTTQALAGLSFVPIVTLSCLEGDWRAGREYSDRLLEVSPLNPQLLALRVLLEHETGESAQGEIYLERLLEWMNPATSLGFVSGRPSMVIAAVYRITGVPDRLEIAESDAEVTLSSQFIRPVATLYAKVALALLAVQKGDQPAAEELYDYLLGHRGTMIWTLSSADRILGLLSQTMGNLDQAAGHFEEALTFCRKAGYHPELVWTYHDYADALLAGTYGRASQPEDQARARSLLDESLAISTELGMQPLIDRVTVRQESLGAPQARVKRYPSNMTERQWEVLQLFAQGNTNREIAEALVLSQRTVQRHIADIYDKIGARNRSEATAFAMSQSDPAK